jgi:uncharacterized protein YkwD
LLSSVNAERRLRALEPLASSQPLSDVAQKRAIGIAESASLDFEERDAEEVLAAVTAAGYSATLAQEVTMVEEGEPADVIKGLAEAQGSAVGFLRHEAKDVGFGIAKLRGIPVLVIIVGVPTTTDSSGRRLPGVAPREWLTRDLFNQVNQVRAEHSLPAFASSEALDAESQRLAEQLLADTRATDVGKHQALTGTEFLYYKATGRWRVGNARTAVQRWFEVERDLVATRSKAFAGTGLASRGTENKLEAVWTLAVRRRP